MASVTARATRRVEAPPERVLAFLRDYRESRPRILTANFSDYRVESGAQGDVIAYRFAAGRREREYRLRAEQSGAALVERDERSTFVSRWTVAADGEGSAVTIESSWEGAGGIPGIFEGLFAPLGLRRIYGEMLDKLAGALAT
jgi:hypothetical protein